MKIMDRMIKKENTFAINHLLSDKHVIKILPFMYSFRAESLPRIFFFETYFKNNLFYYAYDTCYKQHSISHTNEL